MAEVEGIAVDSGDRVRDSDARQTAISECTPADTLKLCALFKAYAFNITAQVEVELTDGGDILADNYMLDLLLVAFPRSLIWIVIGHGTAAGDGQHTLGVNRPCGVLTAVSGGDCL